MLIEIVPYILGATISPVVLAICVMLLAQSKDPFKKTLVFFAGGLTSAIAVGSLVFFVVHTRSQSVRPTLSDSVIHIVVGLVLLILAYRILRKPASKAPKVQKQTHYSRYFLMGLGIVATDFTSLIMFIPAGIELQHASIDVRLTGLALLILALTMAMWGPLLIVLLLGNTGKKLLAVANTFMAKHGQQVTAAVVGLVALYVLYKGVSGLS